MSSASGGTPTSQAGGAVVLDASTCVSRVIIQDSNHAAALTWINNHLLRGGTFVAPILLLTETAASVSRITGLPARAHLAVSVLRSMAELSLVQLGSSLVDEATALAAALKLRGADAYYVALAKIAAVPLVTFDKEQMIRGTGVITTIRP